MADTVGTGVVEIRADTSGLGKDISDKVDGEKGLIGSTFTSLGTGVGKLFKTAAVAAGAGVVAAIAIGKQSIDAASNLDESMSKVNVVFGDASQSVIDWSKTSATAFGQSQQSALEAAGTYGNLFQAFGLDQKPAQEMSQTLVGLAADLASFNNTSVDEALQALQSGVSGETEPLKRYGVAINDTRLKEKALSMGLIKSTKEALTPAAKAQASYALILQDTTLAQGDFARTSDGLANKQRIMGAKFEDIKAKIGKALIPAFSALVGWVADKLIPALGNLAETWMPRIREAFERFSAWVRENWPAIRAAIEEALQAIIEKGRQLWEWFAVNVLPGLRAAFEEIVGWFQRNWHTIRDVTETVLTAIGVAINWIVTVVMPALVDAGTAVANWIRNDLVPALISAYGWFNDNILPVLKDVAAFMSDTLWPAIQNIAGIIADVAVVAFDALSTAITNTWTWLQTVWDRSEGLRGFLADAFAVGLEVGKKAFDLISTAITILVGWVNWLWDTILRPYVDFMKLEFAIGMAVGKVAFDLISDAVIILVGWVNWLWDTILSPFVDWIGAGFKTGMAVANVVFDGITLVVQALITVIETLSGWLDTVIGKAQTAVEWVDKVKPSSSWLLPGINLPWEGKIPGAAKGVQNFAGGLAVVGENGPELVRLPRGADVITNSASNRMLDSVTAGAAGLGGPRELHVHQAPGGADGYTFGRQIIAALGDVERIAGPGWRLNGPGKAA